MKAVLICLALSGFLSQVACSSVKKAEYPDSANAAREITRLQLDLDKAAAHQYALLAPHEMAQARSYLFRAEEDRVRPNRAGEIWSDLGYARGYLNQAEVVYSHRFTSVQSPLEAREAALAAGSARLDSTRVAMDVTDHQFAAAAPTFYRDPKLASVFTERYKNLEVQAAQEVRLGVARRGLAQAIKNGAADYAPQTLKQARGALKRAEDAIAFDPRHQSSYAMEVTQARRAVRWLTAVNSTARATAHRTDEQIAADLIAQNRNLHDLRTQLHGSELESELKGRALTAKEMELRQVNSRLENEKEIQRTIAAVREKFGQDEANVYRDGDKLLIQLKKMDFKSGSAALPDDSRPLLSKVKAIIRDVHAKDVVVQGHADGTGSVKANQHVSEARAEAVADYIEDETGLRDVSVVGLGENRPLRSNKTASGRAVNRRVDLVITPALSEP